MSDDQSWDAKKDEVWRRLVEVEGAATTLSNKLSEVESIAQNKISDNEKAAMDAAQCATDGAKQVTAAVEHADELSPRIAELQQSLPQAQVDVSTVARCAEESKSNALDIVGFKGKSEKATNEIVALQEKARKSVEDAEVKWATTNQQVQNIANLNAQATSDAAAAKAAREVIDSQQKEIAQLKAAFEAMQADWQKNFDQLKTKHSDALTQLYTERKATLDKLIQGKDKELSDLKEVYVQEFNTRTTEIESLLPGATSAGLASAFADRKKDIEKNKRWWAVLLIVAAVLLVSFGCLSLASWGSAISVTSFSGRVIIVAGLILLEEFARRNFNIISRLAESYAYKEALAKSYFGYKKQMEEIPMPTTKADENVMGHSALMKTFLEKLEDEPGKHVFDKEKQIIGPAALIEKLSPDSKDSITGKAIQDFSSGNILTKISWPIAAIVAILVVAVCVIAYFMRGQAV